MKRPKDFLTLGIYVFDNGKHGVKKLENTFIHEGEDFGIQTFDYIKWHVFSRNFEATNFYYNQTYSIEGTFQECVIQVRELANSYRAYKK